MSATNHRTKTFFLRVIAPIVLIFIWLGLSAIGGPYFGKIDQVSSNDLSTFLPKSAESTKVNGELGEFQNAKTIPAIVVFSGSMPLTSHDKDQIATAVTALHMTNHIKGTIGAPIYSQDQKAAFILTPLDSNSRFSTVIPDLQQAVAHTHPSLTYKFTGPAMFAQDLNKAFSGIDGTLLFVAIAVVFVILLVVYRSPLLPVITLLGAMLALSVAILIVWHLAYAGTVQLNGQVQGILFILVIGATTDYSLLYISRYREELTRFEKPWQATVAAWKGAWEPIIAAGGTVTLGLLCLLFSDLGSNKALGPVGGIGIVCAIIAALTFLPASLLLLGRNAYWPRRPRLLPETRREEYRQNHPLWARVGSLVGRHPRRLWVGLSALLLLACLLIPQLKAQGVAQSDFVLGPSEARDGQSLLDAHFPSGSGSPVYVIAPEKDQAAVVAKLDADRGINAVSVTTTDSASPTAPVGKADADLQRTIEKTIQAKQDAQLSALHAQLEAQMAGAPQSAIDQAFAQAKVSIPSAKQLAAAADPFADATPKVVHGNVLLQAVLSDPASSLAARQTVSRLRQDIQPSYPTVQFGGVSAVQLDTNIASDRDLVVIIPLILLAITIVLMLLLRAIVAPLILLLTTVVSFGATLGIAAFAFNNIWHFAGADPSVIIFGFVFLVALGIDYNIFLMTRIREESLRLGTRPGTIKALVVTGGVISSAGIVLASTFAALYVIPILFLAEIAFIVAFGVLLDTLIVRSLIVPSLTLEVGRYMWWPSRLFHKDIK